MATPYPAERFLSGNFAPLRAECDAPDLVLEGVLPPELSGVFYRNGPNPQFAPRDRYHPFTGDGMVHAFRVEGGRVSYRNRWVRTPKLELERAVGESLFGAFGNPMTTDDRAKGTSGNVANTSIVWHDDRLLTPRRRTRPLRDRPGHPGFAGTPRLAGCSAGADDGTPEDRPRQR